MRQAEAIELEGGDVRYREANWVKILDENEKSLIKQIDGAKLNPNTTDHQLEQLEQDLRNVQEAQLEHVANFGEEGGVDKDLEFPTTPSGRHEAARRAEQEAPANAITLGSEENT